MNRTTRIIDFIAFIIIGGVLSVLSVGLLGEPLPERYYYYFTLLITAFMLFLYARSYKLNFDSKWFKASFVLKLIPLSLPIIIIITLFVLNAIIGNLLFIGEWGGLAIIALSLYISWFAYVISIILFAIGYYKSKGKRK